MKCRICGNEKGNEAFEVREMMFGYRDKFSYFQCAACDCLQISDIPENILKYYPPDYYSFLLPSPEKGIPLLQKIKTCRDSFAVLNRGFTGKLIYTLFPAEKFKILRPAKPTKESAILDVGCGSGAYLWRLKEAGFKNLLGIDPFIKKDISYKNGMEIFKKSIQEISGEWDIIMFHHSFEHVPDPQSTLREVSRLLKKGGTFLIRVPTASSWAWKHYRENWIQMDSPRHFFLHSLKSMNILAEKAGLKSEEVIYDSSEFQFWGSEQYQRDIPLFSEYSYLKNPSKDIFSKSDIRAYKHKAKELNKIKQGDSCAFFLKKLNTG